MDFWVTFWSIFFFLSVAIFIGLSITIAIGGFFDIKSLVRSLKEAKHEREAGEEEA